MLRNLMEKDAGGILEWMTDPEINCFFRFNGADTTRDTVLKFIAQANEEDSRTRHFAITSDQDEYLGTISLKNIDPINQNAEYAVSTRKKAHGTGAAAAATKELLHYAFKKLGLHRVYLNVLAANSRAVRFYEKIGFVREGVSRQHLYLRGQFHDLVWFGMNREDYENRFLKDR